MSNYESKQAPHPWAAIDVYPAGVVGALQTCRPGSGGRPDMTRAHTKWKRRGAIFRGTMELIEFVSGNPKYVRVCRVYGHRDQPRYDSLNREYWGGLLTGLKVEWHVYRATDEGASHFAADACLPGIDLAAARNGGLDPSGLNVQIVTAATVHDALLALPSGAGQIWRRTTVGTP